ESRLAADVLVEGVQIGGLAVLAIELQPQRVSETGLREGIADRNVPGVRLRRPAERRERVGVRIVRVAIVNRDVQVRDAGASGAWPAPPAAEAAARAASTSAPLRRGAEGVDETHIDVVELTAGRRDRVEVLAIAGLVRQRHQGQKLLGCRIEA